MLKPSELLSSPGMKITIVTGFFLPVPALAGGAMEKIWHRLGGLMADAGHEVTFISRRWPGLSYSLYLIHAPVVSATRNFIARLIPIGSPWFLPCILLSIIVGLVAGWLFFGWIEAPLERWRKSPGTPRSGVIAST
jgi:peptidoglycan/LPS O-acetylase OafA/YrhL